MIRLAGRRTQLWGRVCWWEWRGERWRADFWSQVSPNQIVIRWRQLEECAANSPSTGHVTFGVAYLRERFERAGRSGERDTSIYVVCIIYFIHTPWFDLIQKQEYGFVSIPCNQTVWLSVAFPSGQTRLHLLVTMSTAGDTFLSVSSHKVGQLVCRRVGVFFLTNEGVSWFKSWNKIRFCHSKDLPTVTWCPCSLSFGKK